MLVLLDMAYYRIKVHGSEGAGFVARHTPAEELKSINQVQHFAQQKYLTRSETEYITNAASAASVCTVEDWTLKK